MVKASELQLLISESVEEIEKMIDKKLLNSEFLVCDKGKLIRVTINCEPSKTVRDLVANKYYTEGGYSFVTHSTSSENNEQPGFTGFDFHL